MSQTRQSTDTDAVIGKHLVALRRAQGVTQHELGAALGVTFQQIQKYERGANRVSAARLLDAARFFRVPVAAFYKDVSGAADLPAATYDPVIADETARLAGAFAILPADKRQAVLTLVAGMAENPDA